MPRVKVNKTLCKGCGLCVIYCPGKLLTSSGSLNKKGIHAISFNSKSDKCTGCAMCALMCPDCAIEVWK